MPVHGNLQHWKWNEFSLTAGTQSIFIIKFYVSTNETKDEKQNKIDVE